MRVRISKLMSYNYNNYKVEIERDIDEPLGSEIFEKTIDEIMQYINEKLMDMKTWDQIIENLDIYNMVCRHGKTAIQRIKVLLAKVKDKEEKKKLEEDLDQLEAAVNTLENMIKAVINKTWIHAPSGYKKIMDIARDKAEKIYLKYLGAD